MKNDERGLKLNCNLCGENHETAKCPELKNMLKMVGEVFARQYPHVATVVTAAKERIEALEAAAEKMLTTKDGVRVSHGDKVYTEGGKELVAYMDAFEEDCIDPDTNSWQLNVTSYGISNCYSTREAAEAAIAKAKGGE